MSRMQKVVKCFCALALACVSAVQAGAGVPASDALVPNIDTQKLEAYVRYTEGYTPQVKLAFDTPTPSAYKGYFRVRVHLSIAREKGIQQVGEKLYYTDDGEHFLSGQLWELGKNPFEDTLVRLPTDGPSFGPANAKVTIVVFSDFECPYCREFAKTLRTKVPQKYPNDVRVIFEAFPIDSIHPWAVAAAEAAHCIADENPEAFWAFHDWIFEHQGEVTPQNLKDKTLAFAQTKNLPAAPLSACLDHHSTAAAVTASLQAGRALQIQQTPTLFVNGRMVGGAVPWETLDAVIQLELGRPKEIPGPSVKACCEVSAPTILGK